MSIGKIFGALAVAGFAFIMWNEYKKAKAGNKTVTIK